MSIKKAHIGKFIALTKLGKKYKFLFKDNGEVDLNGKHVELSLEESSDGFLYAVFGNYRYPVEVSNKNQNKYQVIINNVSYDFSIETPISFRRKKFLQKKHKDVKSAQLIAPMPGKIVDILFEEGAEINSGDAIVILEAMKMQNEIAVDFSGKIKKIMVKAGDNVMKDDVLIEFEK